MPVALGNASLKLMFKPSKTLQLVIATVVIMAVALCCVAIDPAASRASMAGGPHHPLGVAEQSSSPLALGAAPNTRTSALALSTAGGFRAAPKGPATSLRLTQDPDRLHAAGGCFTSPLRI